MSLKNQISNRVRTFSILSQPRKLNEIERVDGLSKLAGWEYMKENDSISKTYTFKNFIDCFSFMTRVAILSEKLNHHPGIFHKYKLKRDR